MSCNCSRYRSIEDMRGKYKKDNTGFEKKDNFYGRDLDRCSNQAYTDSSRCKDRYTSFLEKDSRLNYR